MDIETKITPLVLWSMNHPDFWQSVQKWVSFFVTRFVFSLFYPLTKADNSEKIWAAWQFDLNGDGVVYAFRRDECPDESFTLSLSAIDAAAEYSVSITDERMNENIIRMTGAQLASLTVSTPGMQESLLIEYKKL